MTDLSLTNWRALCAELHAVFNTYAVCQEHHRLLVHTATALAQPEPPSLKEQALEELDAAILRGDCFSTSTAKDTIRRALEQLDD